MTLSQKTGITTHSIPETMKNIASHPFAAATYNDESHLVGRAGDIMPGPRR